MLDDFILTNRDAIIARARARARVARRTVPLPTDVELKHGIPMFLDQLGDALRLAKSSKNVDHHRLDQAAGLHGGDLLRMGLTIGQVVHDYGDVCQVITQLIMQNGVSISADEFQTLNLCLDDAIAGAVTEYARQREHTIVADGTERLGILAHEMRNFLNTATLAFRSIQSGHVAVSGSTGTILAKSLTGLRDLLNRLLIDVRLDAGLERLELISVADFIAEVEIGAVMQARTCGVHFKLVTVEAAVTIEGDRQILLAAIANLLQNAFKFTRATGTVCLTASATSDRVLFDIEDECGGLPPGSSDTLFLPFEQRSADRSGLGLGLAICLKAAKANGGKLRVRDLPGKGCIFTLDLPRKPPPPLSVVAGGVGNGSSASAEGAKSPRRAAPIARASLLYGMDGELHEVTLRQNSGNLLIFGNHKTADFAFEHDRSGGT